MKRDTKISFRRSVKQMQKKRKIFSNLLILYKCGSAHVRRTSSVCLPAGSRPVGYRQDIFAQEMGSSIVCTFVQTVQLRGCAGTTVWFSKVKLHCTRYCVVRVSRCIWNNDAFWGKKKREPLSLSLPLSIERRDCWNRTNDIFSQTFTPIFDAPEVSSSHANSTWDLTWLIPRKLLPEPNWKYRDAATPIARERGEKMYARALHGENRSNRGSIDRSKALPAPHRCPAREPYRKRVEGKERTREWARVPRERKPTSWEGEIESGGR